MDPMSSIRVAAQPEVTERLAQDAPEWLDVLADDGDAPPDDVDVWVVPYAVGRLTPEQVSFDGRPRLKVVQLLSAGVEPWPRLVPAGVTLCSGRGIHGGTTAELAV